MRILIDGQTLSTYEIKRGIGRVFLALINACVAAEDTIEWYITVTNTQQLTYFHPAVAAKLIPIELNLPTHLNPMAHHEFYSSALQTIIDQHKIDRYWNLNPLMLNVFYPLTLKSTPIHIMLHDLIPQVMADVYQVHWSDLQRQAYRQRLESIASHVEHIAAISQGTYDDLIHHFPQAVAKTQVIHHGLDHTQFYPRSIKIPPYGLPYLLYVGGFDPRKNAFLAIEAFAKLCRYPQVDPQLQFYLVCDYTEEQQQQVQQKAEALGISSRLHLCGTVEDEELNELYANAELFFFPSQYEGFGLPVLEAMASGLLIVASDIPPLREIGKDALIYCIPGDVDSMSASLYQALSLPPAQKAHYAERALAIAQRFTWEKTAAAYLKSLQTRATNQPMTSTQHLRIAMVTPWPPETSGIANYSYHLVTALQSMCHVTVFSNCATAYTHNASDLSKSLPLTAYPMAELKQRIKEFDQVIYHLGNHADSHRDIYRLAWQHPGIIILHDFYLHEFMRDAFSLGNAADNKLYQTALAASRQQHATGSAINTAMLEQLPLCEAIVQHSKAVVVHNPWVRQKLNDFDHVHLIPHGAVLHESNLSASKRQHIAQRWQINESAYVIGVFGFMNRTKRFAAIIEAVAMLHHKNYPVQLLVVGQACSSQYNIKELCQRWHVPEEMIKMTGYVEDQAFIELMAFCDIYVGLRMPSMGETSGPLMLALGIGKPCIVSDYQQFAQLRDDICLKVMTEEAYEVPHLAACLESLITQPALRTQLGNNARRYINQYSTYDIAAQRLLEILVCSSNGSEISCKVNGLMWT